MSEETVTIPRSLLDTLTKQIEVLNKRISELEKPSPQESRKPVFHGLSKDPELVEAEEKETLRDKLDGKLEEAFRYAVAEHKVREARKRS